MKEASLKYFLETCSASFWGLHGVPGDMWWGYIEDIYGDIIGYGKTMSPTLYMEQDICEFDIHQSQLFEKSLRGKPWCSFIHLPSGKHTENYGTSPFLIGKSTNFRLGHVQVRKVFVYQLGYTFLSSFKPVDLPVSLQSQWNIHQIVSDMNETIWGFPKSRGYP